MAVGYGLSPYGLGTYGDLPAAGPVTLPNPDSDSHAPPLTYTATRWADGPAGGTQVSAARLNNMEAGVSQSYLVLNTHDDRLDALEAAPGLAPPINPNSKGPTTSRPTPALGVYFYDTTLHQPIWGDGSGWRDYTGTLLGGTGSSNAPQNFTAAAQADNTIRCNWSPVVGASTYKLYESQYPTGVPGGSAIPSTSFVFTPPATATATQIVQEKAFEITSTAENSTVNWQAQYTYIQDIGDQRGYTGGIVGFTSATSDMLAVVKNWNTVAPGNILAKWITGLTKCASIGMGSGASSAASSNLGSAFIADWHTASTDPVWQKVQRDYRETVYWAPAYNAAVADGLSSLGIALYYDTSMNHGPGVPNSNDGSFDDIRSRTTGTKPVNGGSETTWLNNFLNVRSAVLTQWGDNPSNGRITMFRNFVSGGKFTLATPLTWSIYGDSFTMATDPTPPATGTTGTTSPGFTADLFVATTGSDSNPGTSKSAPKATIGAAITAAAAGQTISVAPGTYTGNVVPSKGGTAGGGYITVRSETKWGAIISGDGSGNQSAVDIAHDYLRFQDFEITGTDSSGVRYGVMIETSGNVEIKGCHIHNICQFLTEGTGFQGGAGIDFEGATHSNISLDSNWIHKIGLPTSTQQLVHGLYLSGNCTNTVVSNNLIHQCEDFGIQVFPTTGSSGITHVNNTVFGNGRGIQQANNGVTRNNISFNNRGSNYDIRGTGNTLSNNFSGGTGDVTQSGVTSGVNPLFVRYAIDGTGDLHIQSGSPCVNTGTTTNAPDHDLDGVTRPQGTGIDAGCYEYSIGLTNRTYDFWVTALVSGVESATSNHATAKLPFGS